MAMILAKYGCTPNLRDTIKRVYKGSMFKLFIGELERTIDFKLGVKQGYSFVPVLFLFIFMAFDETLERYWTHNELTKSRFSRNTNSPLLDGQLISHTT